MNNMKIIQYLPLTHPRATLKFVKKLNCNGVMSILDLEDSAQNPFDMNKTRNLKITARKSFLEIVNNMSWKRTDFVEPIYVRVNALTTEFFKEDLETVIAIFNSGFPISGIFLPKIESYDEILQVSSMLASQKFPKGSDNILEIVPMIETVAGVKNLESILDKDKSIQAFSKVHYGHFDYCLDANLWPFPDPNHSLFWNLIEPMIKVILEHNKTYIHTPFPFPNDPNLFWSVNKYLMNLFPEYEIWTCTLNSELSLSNQSEDIFPLKILSPKMSLEYKNNLAKEIQKSFLEGRANRRSFGVSNNRFIPPHQFFASENYLKTMLKK